ncbi:hypothetical protein L9F63_013975, partial [Diploptera punctata]
LLMFLFHFGHVVCTVNLAKMILIFPPMFWSSLVPCPVGMIFPFFLLQIVDKFDKLAGSNPVRVVFFSRHKNPEHSVTLLLKPLYSNPIYTLYPQRNCTFDFSFWFLISNS